MAITHKDVFFSVHDYDVDGDIHEKGIYLHFGPVRILVAENMDEFKKTAERIANMPEEINENYHGV